MLQQAQSSVVEVGTVAQVRIKETAGEFACKHCLLNTTYPSGEGGLNHSNYSIIHAACSKCVHDYVQHYTAWSTQLQSIVQCNF